MSHPTRQRKAIPATAPVIAGGSDWASEIAEIARVVEGAAAGVVLTRAGDTVPLPGLPDHPLLVRGSPVLAAAAGELAESRAPVSFLAPTGSGERLARVTTLDCARSDLDHFAAAVLVSSPRELRGLGPLELRVLGLLIDGTISVPAIAAVLGVTAWRVADALGAALNAFAAPNPTAAAVRALRAGLRIPPQLADAGRTSER